MGWALAGVGVGVLIMLLAVRSGRRARSQARWARKSGIAWSVMWLLIGTGLVVGQVSKVLGGLLLVSGVLVAGPVTLVMVVLYFVVD